MSGSVGDSGRVGAIAALVPRAGLPRWLALGLLTILVGWVVRSAMSTLAIVATSMSLPDALCKDFSQQWTMGRAALVGADPYTPTVVLASRYVSAAEGRSLPFPSPYPPGAVLFGAPFACVDYSIACAVWGVLEIALLVWLVTSVTIGLSSYGRIAFFIAALAWTPTCAEMQYGQVNLLVTALLWAAAGGGRAAGGFGGIAVALKLSGAPLLAMWALRGEVHRALVAVVVAVGLTVAAVGWTGTSSSLVWATSVLPTVGEHFRGSEYNIAPSAIAWRLFAGTGGTVVEGESRAAVIDLGAAGASIASAAVTAALGAVALGCGWGVRRRAHGVALMILIGAFSTPVAWSHTPVAAIPALGLLVRSKHRFSVGLAALGVVLAQSPSHLLHELVADLSGAMAPFLHGLPTLGALTIGLALWLDDRWSPAPAAGYDEPPPGADLA